MTSAVYETEISIGLIPPCKKSKRPHSGTQILSQIPEGEEGNRGQMPHICPGSSPLGLNIDRYISIEVLFFINTKQLYRLVPGPAQIYYFNNLGAI